jgi:hypothetical protein
MTCRLNDSGRDQLAESGNESVCALNLLPDFLIGHADFSALHRSAIFTGSS